jgi:hypothetical protein
MDTNPLETLLGDEPEGEDTHVEDPAPETPPAPAPAEPGHVPLGTLLDEREKRQAAERTAKALEDRLAAQQPQPPDTPEARFEATRYADNLRYSRKFADKAYGADLVSTVHDWAFQKCASDPFFNAQMRSSDDPYEAAMQAYNREQILAKVSPSDLEAFEAWKAANAAAQAQTPATPHPPAVAPLPRSLADAPGTGGAGRTHIPVGPGEAFAAAISR